MSSVASSEDVRSRHRDDDEIYESIAAMLRLIARDGERGVEAVGALAPVNSWVRCVLWSRARGRSMTPIFVDDATMSTLSSICPTSWREQLWLL